MANSLQDDESSDEFMSFDGVDGRSDSESINEKEAAKLRSPKQEKRPADRNSNHINADEFLREVLDNPDKYLDEPSKQYVRRNAQIFEQTGNKPPRTANAAQRPTQANRFLASDTSRQDHSIPLVSTRPAQQNADDLKPEGIVPMRWLKERPVDASGAPHRAKKNQSTGRVADSSSFIIRMSRTKVEDTNRQRNTRTGSLKAHNDSDSPRSSGSTRVPKSPRATMNALAHSESELPFSGKTRPPKSPRAQVDTQKLRGIDPKRAAKNYPVEYSLDLSNYAKNRRLKECFDAEFNPVTGKETVTKMANSRTDVTGILQRDFEHSTYQYVDDEGDVHPLNSIDDFVHFVDPDQTGLAKQVSRFACQTLGIWIKHIFQSQTDKNGQPTSPLKLADGTPVFITVSPHATYQFKKEQNGQIVLSYLAEYNTPNNGLRQKNTARLVHPVSGMAVPIENAKANVTLDITFNQQGDFQMGELNLRATGWNQVTV